MTDSADPKPAKTRGDVQPKKQASDIVAGKHTNSPELKQVSAERPQAKRFAKPSKTLTNPTIQDTLSAALENVGLNDAFSHSRIGNLSIGRRLFQPRLSLPSLRMMVYG